MGKLYNGGASFGFSLNYNTAVPVDTRIVVKTITDLKDPQTWISGSYDAEHDENNVYTVYPGLAVAVTDEKTVYVFSNETVNGTTIADAANWSRLATGNNTGALQSEVDNIETAVGLNADGTHITATGNYTKDATTIAGEISALDSELKNTNDALGTKEDSKETDTAFGRIAKEVADRTAAIEALDAEVLDSDGNDFITVKVTEVNGVITAVEVTSDDIASSTELKAEEAKIANSATIKEVTTGDIKTYETAVTIKYVAAVGEVGAHIALVDKNDKELSTVPVADIIGNGVLKKSSYNATTGILTLTFATASGKDTTVGINLGALLDIEDVMIDADSTDYLKVTTTPDSEATGQAVFKALIKKMADASYAEGAVVTGLADAADVKKYVDEAVSSKNVSAEGDEYITATAANNKVTVTADVQNLTVGKEGTADSTLTGTEKSLVDGADVASKVSSFVEARLGEEIAKLDSTVSASDSNVNVEITETDGKLTGLTISEDYATITKTAKSGAVGSEGHVAPNYVVADSDEDKLVKASDIKNLKDYADDAIAEAVEGLDASVTSSTTTNNIGITVTEVDGKLTGASVTEKYATVTRIESAGETKAAISVTNGDQLVKGNDIAAVAGYAADKVAEEQARVDAKIAALDGDVKSDDDTFVAVEVKTAAGEVSDVIVTQTVQAIESADETHKGLAETSDVKAYVDKKTTDLAVTAQGDTFVNATVDSTNNKHVKVSANTNDLVIAKADGADTTISGTATTLVNGSEIATKVGTFTNTRIAEEIAKLNATDVTGGSTTTAHVEVKVTETAGKITGVTVNENDIASAALLGTTADDKTKETAFGKIAKEASDRETAINTAITGLKKDATTTNGTNVHVTVSETNGIVSVDSVSEDYTTVTRTAHSDTANAAIAITDPTKLATGAHLQDVVTYSEEKLAEEVAKINSTVDNLNADVTSDDGTNIVVKVTESKGKITAVNVTDSYATVTRTAKETGTPAITVANGEKLATGSDVEKAVKYAEDIVKVEEEARVAAINGLDLEKTADNAKAQDTKGYVKTTISETDGIVKNEGVDVTYGSFKDGETATVPGIATVEGVDAYTRFEKGAGNNSAVLKGTGTTANNENEVAIGHNNISNTGDSADTKTLFSVGNGSSSTSLANAFEVRENGDIYINIGSDYRTIQAILSNEIDWYEGD